jgi:outer membrane lipopolysaccharide assembly protein LptE/RlpB
MRNSIFWSVAVALIFLSGCGYRFSGGGELPAGVQRIFLVIFDNRTSEIGVENDLAASMANTFTTLGNKDALAGNRQNADAELNGAISSIEIFTVSRRVQTVSAERRVVITVSARLTSTDGRVLWQSEALSVSQAYRVALGNQETEADKRAAIRSATELLADKIYNNLTSNF